MIHNSRKCTYTEQQCIQTINYKRNLLKVYVNSLSTFVQCCQIIQIIGSFKFLRYFEMQCSENLIEILAYFKELMD